MSEQSAMASFESHRGGFGDLGGEERGFIDRSFREKIILVGLDMGISSDLSIAAQMSELERLYQLPVLM